MSVKHESNRLNCVVRVLCNIKALDGLSRPGDYENGKPSL